MATPAPYYTAREIEESLGVTGCTLHRWRARGVGPSWNMRGGRVHYPVADFESLLDLTRKKEALGLE